MGSITVLDLAMTDTRLKRVAHGEYAGPCPGCGGTDRFHVNVNKRDGAGGWMCRQCWDATVKGWGDAIEYLRQFRNMTFSEAREFLADEVNDSLQRVNAIRQKKAIEPDYGMPPSEQWQDQASEFVKQAIERLWSDNGSPVLEYLRSRGLEDGTIRKAKLGAVLREQDQAEYAVIPWYADGQLWRVNMRDIRSEIPKGEPKYRHRKGGSNSGLYLGDCLKARRDLPVFMVEGEIDALSIVQDAGDLVNVVSTGTTTGSRTPRWIGRLAGKAVFVAYDADEDGEKHSDYWIEVLDAIRYRPLAHDANTMLLDGWNVRSWIQGALLLLSDLEEDSDQQQDQDAISSLVESRSPAAPDVETVNQDEPDQVESGESICCSVCGLSIDQAETFHFSDDGTPYCHEHLPYEPVEDSSPELLQFAGVVSRIAGIFETCELTRVPDGYTLTKHAKTLRKPYAPYTLPALPRRKCPHVVLSANYKHLPCNGKPLASGWCEQHASVQTLLDLGALLGYPALKISEHRSIGAGIAQWEGYAEIAPVKWLRNDLPKLKAMADREALN